MTFDQVTDDAGNDYNIINNSINPNTFVAPLWGLYHFSGFVKLQITFSVHHTFEGNILISVNGVGTVASPTNQAINKPNYSTYYVKMDSDIGLFAGYSVNVQVQPLNAANLPASTSDKRLSGHLIYAD